MWHDGPGNLWDSAVDSSWLGLPVQKGHLNRANWHVLFGYWRSLHISAGGVFGYPNPEDGKLARSDLQGVYPRGVINLLRENVKSNEAEFLLCEHCCRGIPWCDRHVHDGRLRQSGSDSGINTDSGRCPTLLMTALWMRLRSRGTTSASASMRNKVRLKGLWWENRGYGQTIRYLWNRGAKRGQI